MDFKKQNKEFIELCKKTDILYSSLEEYYKKYPWSNSRVIAQSDMYESNRNKCDLYKRFAYKFNKSERYGKTKITYVEGPSDLFTDNICEVYFDKLRKNML